MEINARNLRDRKILIYRDFEDYTKLKVEKLPIRKDAVDQILNNVK